MNENLVITILAYGERKIMNSKVLHIFNNKSILIKFIEIVISINQKKS